jgi:hypothetical protein
MSITGMIGGAARRSSAAIGITGMIDGAGCRSSAAIGMFEPVHGRSLPLQAPMPKRLNDWVPRMFQVWTILDHIETQTEHRRSLTDQWVAASARRSSKASIRSIREVPAGLEIRPPRKDADAIAIISEQQPAAFQVPRTAGSKKR